MQWNGWSKNRVAINKIRDMYLCSAMLIAEVKSDFAVKVGDLLSPLQNALYCINREKLHTVKVLSASSYSPDEWERQCKSAGKIQ